jgi:hypothetical protein
MSNRIKTKVIRSNLHEHPAVNAWRALRSDRVKPEVITVLKEHDKSLIYRLGGLGPAGTGVIAKRCRQATATIERTIYEEILPCLPLSTLSYYGFVEEPDGEFCWLFLEDAGGEEFSWDVEEHRTLAAHWLGTLHTSATGLAAAAQLPDRGPNYYLERLHLARRNILQNLGNPALTSDDLRLLQKIVSQCDILEARWDEVQGFCDRMPHTLVHGDLAGKNIRIRSSPVEIAFVAIDWETAGWGVPAADLEPVDIGLYWSLVRKVWPQLVFQDIVRLTHHGALFRCLIATSWESWSLRYEWLEKSMSRLAVYQARLANIIQLGQ